MKVAKVAKPQGRKWHFTLQKFKKIAVLNFMTSSFNDLITTLSSFSLISSST
ncbi:hypothetical protein HanRHA438_Chr03g0100441 [Helianthus annuus]|nr:hypothetical protein HanRHA438_Chr03g0100441 [Helianthus annuus]